jgi:hypothetical protein
MPLAQLVNWLNRQRDRAFDAHPPGEHRVHFGGRNLSISGPARALERLNLHGLWPATERQPEIRVSLLSHDDLNTLPDASALRRGAYGAILDADAGGGVRPADELSPWLVCIEQDQSRLLAYDTERKLAILWPGSVIPPRELAEFCRPLLHWAAIGDRHVVVHAAGIARNGRAVLIAGAGNAGKTTLVRACLAAGFDYMGDNVVEVSTGRLHEGFPMVWGVYPTLKVRPDGPVFDKLVFPEPSWDDEARKNIYFLGGPTGRGFQARPMIHAATLVLSETGPQAIEAFSKGEAFFSTAPNTVAQFPFFSGQALERLRQVSEQAPAYTAGRLQPSRIPEYVMELLA